MFAAACYLLSADHQSWIHWIDLHDPVHFMLILITHHLFTGHNRTLAHWQCLYYHTLQTDICLLTHLIKKFFRNFRDLGHRAVLQFSLLCTTPENSLILTININVSAKRWRLWIWCMLSCKAVNFNPLTSFVIFDIWALWRSVLTPEC